MITERIDLTVIERCSLSDPARMRGARLVLRGVDKIFETARGDVRALERIDLAVLRGEFVCVLGPSGCGKSTLLNVVAGFDRQSTGEVLLDARPITGPGAERGVVFQQGSLFEWMTVRDNVAFGPRAGGTAAAEANAIADRHLARVGLGGFEGRFPYELSGGMQQRVGIARALANDPEILLMDEPFAALDQQNRELLQEEIKRIWRDTGRTVLWITHSIEEALYLATHIVVMTARPGRIKGSYRVMLGTDDLLVMTSAAFAEAKRELFQLLREEVMAAQQQDREASLA